MTPRPFFLAAAGMGCCALAQHWWHKRVLQSEHRYRHLIERAPIGIAVVVVVDHMQSAHPAFRQMLGSSLAQQIDILTFPPLVEAGFAADLHRCLGAAAPVCTEHSYTGPSGQRIYLRCHRTRNR